VFLTPTFFKGQLSNSFSLQATLIILRYYSQIRIRKGTDKETDTEGLSVFPQRHTASKGWSQGPNPSCLSALVVRRLLLPALQYRLLRSSAAY